MEGGQYLSTGDGGETVQGDSQTYRFAVGEIPEYEAGDNAIDNASQSF